jgi:hypothetical protein
MRVDQISSELASDIEAMARLAHDQSISESDRNQQLKELKTSVITRIHAESNSISFAGKSFLNEIKEIVEADDWAALPEPKSIRNSLSEMKVVVAIINSIENNLPPTMEAIQRLFFEASLKMINALTNSEISSVEKQWGAATAQFKKSEEAAGLERTSGIITASVGLGVAIVSTGAKIGVTSHSSKSFKDNAPKENDIKLNSDAKALQNTAEADFQKINDKTVAVDNKIATAKNSIEDMKTEYAKPNKTPAEKSELQNRINEETHSLDALQNERDSLDQSYKVQKDQYKVASKIADRNSAHIEQMNTAASKEVQTFRAFLDIVDSSGAVLQNIAKVINAAKIDSEAAAAKLASEMAAYMVNLFASSIQNSQKSAGQIMDGMNSVSSSCNASIQSADSSNSLAVRAV